MFLAIRTHAPMIVYVFVLKILAIANVKGGGGMVGNMVVFGMEWNGSE